MFLLLKVSKVVLNLVTLEKDGTAKFQVNVKEGEGVWPKRPVDITPGELVDMSTAP